VLIAAPEFLAALTERASAEGVEVLAFTDTEALRALETITRRRPNVVALERLFATTSRGAALINRIKADPALGRAELRVVTPDPEPASPKLPADAPASGPSSPALDQRGTRRAPRVAIAGGVEMTIDGNGATLVNLSKLGAQVISPTVLKPNQRVRASISDSRVTIRVIGTIMWALFEIPARSGPCYRAGIEFVNPDVAALEAFCETHRG
jgi:hypothetical protein